MDSPSKFSSEELNGHYSRISFDSGAPSTVEYLERISIPEDHFPRFSLSEVNHEDVKRAVCSFTSQARGSDEIPQSFIKSAFSVIGPYIVQIMNSSIRESIFPSVWKKSLVLALNKIAVPQTMSDTRPIALLCFLSKILERLVHGQISNYVETRKLLDPYQTGYRRGHSTQTALLKLTDDVREGMEKKHVTLLLLFDFSKAFDSVSHVKLLQKLRNLDFDLSALRWVASYLTGREQAVLDDNGVPSSFTPLNKGVPQGSVLGPLLFILFMIDIACNLNGSIFRLLYADDLQLYVRFPLHLLHYYVILMSQFAELVLRWASENDLLLNVAKTKAIVIGSYYYINELSKHEIKGVTFNGSLIKFESSVKSLGVIIDSKLDWKLQVAAICKRSNSLMYRLNFFRKSTTLRLRKHLIESLLFPLIDYCSLVISSVLTKSSTKKLNDTKNNNTQRLTRKTATFSLFLTENFN